MSVFSQTNDEVETKQVLTSEQNVLTPDKCLNFSNPKLLCLSVCTFSVFLSSFRHKRTLTCRLFNECVQVDVVKRKSDYRSVSHPVKPSRTVL